jgi:hypothetical protein
MVLLGGFALGDEVVAEDGEEFGGEWFRESDWGASWHFVGAKLVVDGVWGACAEGEAERGDVGDGVGCLGGEGLSESACAGEDGCVWVVFLFPFGVSWAERWEGRVAFVCAFFGEVGFGVLLDGGEHLLEGWAEVLDALIEDEGAFDGRLAWGLDFDMEFDGHG